MIAISYRREDSLPVAGRLYDRLQTEFGKGNVFMDFDSIPYSVDFRDHIKQMIDQSKVLVAMIGPDWVGRRRHRGRRIDDPGDFVRIEIAYALNRKLPIIPVLVNSAQMPSPEQLPKDIEGLAFRNALNLDVGIDFHHHAEKLAVAINRILTAVQPKPPDLEETRPQEIPGAPHVPLVPSESQLEAMQPSSVPIIEKPLSREPLRPPPTEAEDETRDRRTNTQTAAIRPATATHRPPRPPIINWKAKIGAIKAAFRCLWQATHNALSAAKSRAVRFFDSVQMSVHRCVRISTDRLYRHRKAIGLSALCLLVLATGAGAIYFGLRSGTFQVLLVQTTKFFKSRNVSNGNQSSPQPNGVVPRGRENPLTVSPITSPAPTQIRGALLVDSTPQGEAYEVIDANSKHHIGKTPETLEDLPGGYAQVIFKREGFSDHSETVWIAANTKPSVTWNFPEDYRLKTSTQLNPSPTPASAQSSVGIAPRISEIKASSELKPQSYQGEWKGYDASLAFDGKNDTAWCSNGGGPGDWVMVRFESPASLRGVWVYGGYGSDSDRYKTNNRVRTLRVSFSDGTAQDLEFEDRMSLQRFQFPRLVTTEWAKFEIIGVYRGTRYDATPISEIQFDYATDNLAIRPTPSPSSPIPTPSLNPAAQNGRAWQAWISDFVRQFVMANESPDPNPPLACYAPNVSYFDEKNQDQAYIRQDIERYNVRWPIRHDEIEGDIHLQEKVPGQQCIASFKLNFYAESPQRNIWTKGQFAIDLEITLIDGLPKITAIREKTVHQQKGRPGASPKPSSTARGLPSGIPVQGKPGIVRSPYAPTKGEIDIRRYAKGAQVKCPFTGKIFIAP